jgi:hypothetical protein
VRHEDEGDAELALELLQLDLHLLAELEVEGAEGLVEQQDLGTDDHRAGEGDALALPAGELGRSTVGDVVEAHGREGLAGAAATLGLADPAHAQPVRDVLEHAHVREERVVLEDGVDVALEGCRARDVATGELHRAAGRLLEAGHETQHRGLARPGRSEHREELAVGDLEVDAVDGTDVAEVLLEPGQADRGGGAGAAHRSPSAGVPTPCAPGREGW